ncbi:acyl-CoA dehydrogenase family protein [Microbulbifer agarilyticus]|uniref:acyl-CoA dehydrogenase family protein n=1 Tax=Microbulbifer agarilyticus TaxID=260552 RepID=UPI001C937FA6|nr:acyl-CoA dehydrogenase family protein [Microbulbifer agarilyticus]MBY6189859.1 acyl-CoA dehydrogenase family protein [Microbulbifer agarilyticus]MCA0892388.1 acyl-CoA dehydrogenase family protein [Microbulbifer agarilyticus]
MHYELNEDQVAFQETARKFAETSMAPHAARWDAEHIFPTELFVEAGALGFMSLYVPEEDGGIGLSRLDSTLVIEELATGCTSTAAYISIHNMALNMLARYGSAALKAYWCEALASGHRLASYCLTEPGSGSDAASLSTRADRDGDQYIINGSKCFISGAGDTDLLITMVRTGEPGPRGITCVAIPADTAGIHYGKAEEKMGWNSQPTRTVTFENVKVPIENRLAEEGQGFKLAMEALDGGRINIAACSVGAARACVELSSAYVQERKQFDRPVADFQNTQFKLADMATQLVASRQMIRLAAAKLDQGSPDRASFCAMAKRFATDTCFSICDEAIQLHGGYGYIREYPIERYFRDTRVHRILEGTNEIMRLVIARQLLSERRGTLIE